MDINYILKFYKTIKNMKNAVFWDVASCRFCVKRRFGGTSVYTAPHPRRWHSS
jgi:hypothetical protein